MKRELNEYDFLKSICVILVLIGHVCSMYNESPTAVVLYEVNGRIELIRKIIYEVIQHMPVFFAISGAIYQIQISRGKYLDQWSFFVGKFKRLMIPYIVFAIFIVFPTMCVITHIDNPLLYIIDSYLLVHNSRHLWFLVILFQTFIVFNLFRKQIDDFPLVALVVFVLLNILKVDISLIKPSYLLWFYMGYLIQKYDIIKQNSYCFLPLILVPFVSRFLVGSGTNYPLISIIYPFCMFTSLFTLFKYFKSNRIIGVLSDNGMGIYLFHPIIIYLVTFCSRDFVLQFKVPVVYSFLFLFIVALSFSIGLTIIVRKINLKWMLGE